ncbi:MAG TPA: hypothetical protein V6D19_08730 [Stenomitos sp.]
MHVPPLLERHQTSVEAIAYRPNPDAPMLSKSWLRVIARRPLVPFQVSGCDYCLLQPHCRRSK